MVDIIVEYIIQILDNSFLNWIGNYIKDHKDLVYSFAILLVTLIIPYAFEVFRILWGDDVKFREVKSKIFTEELFNIKFILLSYSVIFCFLFLWNNEKNIFLLPLLLWIVVVIFYLIWSVIINLNLFMVSKDFRDKKIKEKIFSLDINQKTFRYWENALSTNFNWYEDFYRELVPVLFQKFWIKFQKWFNSEDWNLLNLLSIYNDNNRELSKRNFFEIDGHLLIFLDMYKELYFSDKRYHYSHYMYEILKRKITSLEENDTYIWGFYNDLKKYIKNNSSTEEEKEFIVHLISRDIVNIFFDNATCLENDELMQQFPFKISETNLQKKNYEAKIINNILNTTLSYVIRDLQTNNRRENIEIDKGIDNILRHWYSFIDDIILFSIIIQILLIPYGEDRIESILKSHRRFWHIWRVMTWIGENYDFDTESERQYKRTIDNIKKYLPGLLNKENILSILSEMNDKKNLSKDDNRRIRYYIKILNDLIK